MRVLGGYFLFVLWKYFILFLCHFIGGYEGL